MSVDRQQVEAMARLAQLSVSTEEADRIATQMSRILQHADRLRAIPDDEMAGGIAGLGSDDINTELLGSGPNAGHGQPAVPDALGHALADFAPRFEQGFFVVPPPPGVVPETDCARGTGAEADGASGG
jgi:Asp-tRNA(Asn)/Glu-tRNA(Gln) amidotransferase C subunit